MEFALCSHPFKCLHFYLLYVPNFVPSDKRLLVFMHLLRKHDVSRGMSPQYVDLWPSVCFTGTGRIDSTPHEDLETRDTDFTDMTLHRDVFTLLSSESDRDCDLM